MLVILELAALIATVVLAALWIRNPSGNYEPWTVLCGIVFTVGEVCRRHTKRFDHTSVPVSRKELLLWLQEQGSIKPLSELLPRTLQLAQTIQNKELEHWVRMELYGYNSDGGMTEGDNVPEYRAIGGRHIDIHDRILHFDDPKLHIVNVYRIRLGIGQLEELAKKTDMQNIQDPGYLQIIRENLGVDVYRFCFNPVEVVGVLQNIRNRMLEKVSAISNA